MGKGHGFGKTILFGEHFVVYGLPAIAAALGSKTNCEIERISDTGWELEDNRPATPGYKDKKKEEQVLSINNILEHLKIDKGIKITFAGDLYAASGVGASAASSVALARALNDEFELNCDNEKINQAGYEGEKGYHGETPSGIDNTVSTFGGLIWFVKNHGEPNTMDKLKIPKSIELVIGNTGLTASTTDVVADVRKQKEANPEKFDRIFEDYKALANEAKQALQKGDLPLIGKLMDKNHDLLEEITVTCDELNALVEIAHENDALGAKMTGTGRGGLVIALVPDKRIQEKLAQAFEAAGFMAWRTTIGV